MNLPLVYIVVLNFNGHKDTIDCVNSLNQISYNNYKIVIVDNNSQDNSEAILREEFPQIDIIQSGRNLGYSGGNNIGIKYAISNNAEYILLINNDTVVEKDFLNKLVDVAIKDKNIGIVGGKIMEHHNRTKIQSIGGYISESKGCGYNFANINNNLIGDNCTNVTFVSGCMQLINKEVFVKIDYLDEDYFLYMEDVDFCHRTLKGKFTICVTSMSIIYHKESSSTCKNSPLYLYYMNRNRMLFVKKNVKYIHKKIFFYIFFVTTRIIRILKYKRSSYYIYLAIKHYFTGCFGEKFEG